MAIVCRDLKLLFIMVPATGCSALGGVLLKQFGGEWVPSKPLFRRGRRIVSKKHNSIGQLRKWNILSRDELDGYIKFATIRNPFDANVSSWHRWYRKLDPSHRKYNPRFVERAGGGSDRPAEDLARARRDFEVRVDSAFDEVLAACADSGRDGDWIDDDVIAAYRTLHELGWAHSVETWQDGRLVGGLYGVCIGGLFAGESMFHRERDASKVALVALVDLLDDQHAEQRVLDVQWQTPHLASLGVVRRPRAEYLESLGRALAVPLPPPFRVD